MHVCVTYVLTMATEWLIYKRKESINISKEKEILNVYYDISHPLGSSKMYFDTKNGHVPFDSHFQAFKCCFFIFVLSLLNCWVLIVHT